MSNTSKGVIGKYLKVFKVLIFGGMRMGGDPGSLLPASCLSISALNVSSLSLSLFPMPTHQHTQI